MYKGSIWVGVYSTSYTLKKYPSKADTTGTKNFVRCSKVSLAQGLVVDHAPGPLLQLRPAMIKYYCGQR